jgi:hypothetical protein
VPNWPDDVPSTSSSRADERSVIRHLPHPTPFRRVTLR